MKKISSGSWFPHHSALCMISPKLGFFPLGRFSHICLYSTLSYFCVIPKVQIANPLPGSHQLLLAHTTWAHMNEAPSSEYLLLPPKNTDTQHFLLKKLPGTFLGFSRQCLCFIEQCLYPNSKWFFFLCPTMSGLLSKNRNNFFFLT